MRTKKFLEYSFVFFSVLFIFIVIVILRDIGLFTSKPKAVEDFTTGQVEIINRESIPVRRVDTSHLPPCISWLEYLPSNDEALTATFIQFACKDSDQLNNLNSFINPKRLTNWIDEAKHVCACDE